MSLRHRKLALEEREEVNITRNVPKFCTYRSSELYARYRKRKRWYVEAQAGVRLEQTSCSCKGATVPFGIRRCTSNSDT